MAYNKVVMKRGTYVKGYQLTVLTTDKDYTLDIDTNRSALVANVQLIADDSDAGDYYTIEHISTTAAGFSVIKTLGNTIYNPGPGAGFAFDFPALEPINSGESLRITYTHAASTAAISVNVYVTFIGPTT